MSTFNPQSRNLIVLSVKLRNQDQQVDYLFPLNPSSLSINQANRVSATFTYGAKVFQNLGAGLKTISMEGHTGYRLDAKKYGLQEATSILAWGAQSTPGRHTEGKQHWLDLYAVIQLIKGENKYLRNYKFTQITSNFDVRNIDNIESVKITIPDQSITYDVILQNDSFMRNREQPNLYKYKLDFLVIGESFGTPSRKSIFDGIPVVGDLVSKIKSQAGLLQDVKDSILAFPGVQQASDLYDTAVDVINETVDWGNFFITSANSSINDLRRLERMTDALNGVAENISLIKGIVEQIKTFDDLDDAFYEPYIRIKNIQAQQRLLKTAMTGDTESLSFNVNLTRLASISAPVTLAANKATVAQFDKDIRKLNSTQFPFPIDKVQEIVINGKRKINISFSQLPSSFGISGIKIYAVNDFGKENDFVESFSDSGIVMSTNYDESGFMYNFIIEYNYSSFESIIQSKYKSIKRIFIKDGETIESIVKKYAPLESNASRSYISEVAYLNNIEYPYVVTSSDPIFNAYFGSYGYKIFESNGEFLQYIYNIDISLYPGNDLPLYDPANESDPLYAEVDDETVFLLQQQELIDKIKEYNKFFVLLFKETYSNRCYALFGLTNNTTCNLFSADAYVLCALHKGRSYDIETNSLFEILSPYTITGDLIDYYDQRTLFDSYADSDIEFFDKEVAVIEEIYSQYVGSFTEAASFPFGQSLAEKEFLSGDYENKNYVILTNFTAVGAMSSSTYAIQAFSEYNVLTNGQEILIPSFAEDFLSFAKAFTKEDTYKVDLDIRFTYFDDINVSILPRPDLGAGQGILDFKLVAGLDNVKQAIRDRLECPQGGYILHLDYGLPLLLGKKNTLENLILLRYSLFSQLMSDPRIKSVDDIRIEDKGDTLNAVANVVLVNNDETLIQTSI